MGHELKTERIKRVVVRGANWVGDAVMTVPALRELRRVLPGAHVTLATRAWAAPVFDGADFLDDILPLAESGGKTRAVFAAARALRPRGFDLAFEQVEVAGGSPLEGRKLKDTTIRSRLDVVVAAIRRANGEMVFNPSGDTQIRAGDMLICIGRAESMVELAAQARGERK